MNRIQLDVRKVSFPVYDAMREHLRIGSTAGPNRERAYGRIVQPLLFHDFYALLGEVDEDAARIRKHFVEQSLEVPAGEVIRVSFKVRQGMNVPSTLEGYRRRDWIRIPIKDLGTVIHECGDGAEEAGYLSLRLKASQLRGGEPCDYEIDFNYHNDDVVSSSALIPRAELEFHGWNDRPLYDVRALWVPEGTSLTPNPLYHNPERLPLLEQRLAVAREGSSLFRQRLYDEAQARRLQPIASGDRKTFWMK